MSGATAPCGLAELTASVKVRECLQWFSRNRKWIDRTHLELCRIPAPTFQEQERAEWMAAQLRQLGWDARLDRAGNVVAQQGSRRDLPTVALTAHLDTVLAPREGEIQFGGDGRLTGPGVSDNGAGLAALLAIARVLADQPVFAAPLPLLLVANVGEEGEGNLSGMRYLCRPAGAASKVGSFVVLDGPSLDHITSRALASRRCEITLSGPGGHSWSDFGTGNPVHALGRAIAYFCENAPAGEDGSRSSYNFGLIEGGTSINSIPAFARAKLDLRSENPARIDDMAALLTVALERAMEQENGGRGGGRVTAKVREIGSRPGGHLPPDAPLLSRLQAVDSHLGLRPQLDCASTDANVPLSLGIPAVSIGAGGQGGGAHTPAEWYHPEGRERGLRRLLLLLLLLSADADPTLGRSLSA